MRDEIYYFKIIAVKNAIQSAGVTLSAKTVNDRTVKQFYLFQLPNIFPRIAPRELDLNYKIGTRATFTIRVPVASVSGNYKQLQLRLQNISRNGAIVIKNKTYTLTKSSTQYSATIQLFTVSLNDKLALGLITLEGKRTNNSILTLAYLKRINYKIV